jgi:type VI protein secretion system component VasK
MQTMTDSQATAQLTAAKANASYDQVYQRIVGQKLAAITAQASDVYQSTNNPTIQQSMQSVYDHFTELNQRLSDIKL